MTTTMKAPVMRGELRDRVLGHGGRARMGRLMRLIGNGGVDPTRLATHRFHFSEIGKALDMMTTKADGIIRPVIRFD